MFSPAKNILLYRFLTAPKEGAGVGRVLFIGTRGKMMNINLFEKGSYSLIKIENKIYLHSEISECLKITKELVSSGKKTVVLSFPEKSFFDSHCLSTILQCHEAMHTSGGKFIIIKPTYEILSFLKMFQLENDITTCNSEEEIPGFSA